MPLLAIRDVDCVDFSNRVRNLQHGLLRAGPCDPRSCLRLNPGQLAALHPPFAFHSDFWFVGVCCGHCFGGGLAMAVASQLPVLLRKF